MTTIQIFYVLATVFTFIFLFLNVAAFFGADSDMDSDIDGDSDFDSGAGGIFGEALTLRSLINFLTFFAWIGIFCIEQQYSVFWIVVISTGVSFLLTILLASIMFGMKQLQSTQPDIGEKDFINKVATVYLCIPGNDKKGKIQLSVRGSFRNIEALSETGERIDTNSQVTVTSFIADGLVRVSKLKLN
jgi:hypothetical protein